MEKMLSLINDCIKVLSQFREEATKIIKNQNVKEENLLIAKDELSKKSDDIFKRELEVKKIEDILAISEEAKKATKETLILKTAVQKDKDSFGSFKNEEVKKLNTLRNQLTEQSKQIANEYTALKREKELLEKDKQTYKDKLAQGLVNLANKK